MTRDTFSIDHKNAWLDSGEPHKVFFDLQNIAFSHKICNTSNARHWKKWSSQREQWAAEKRKYYSPIKRHEKYINKGY